MLEPARTACALALAAGLLGAGWAGAADERVITYGKDTLTVRLTRVPVAEVVAEIGHQTGAEIRGEVRSASEVTAEFEDVPLPEALHRLLGDQNFALIYGDGGRLKAVRLLGGPQAPAGGALAVSTATTLPPMQAAPVNLAGLVARHEPVPVSGRLAEIAGSSSAPIQQLFEIGMRNEDAGVRAEAVRALVSTLEGDPTLRASVIGELGTMDDKALSALLRSAAGDHAEEVAMHILTQSRASELRVKASSVLQKLRTGS